MKKRTDFLPYSTQQISDEDIKTVIETLKSPYLTTGPKVSEFEKVVADYVGATYAVAFSNGTAALHAACYAAGITQGDEVITTPITFAASANCVRYMGGEVIFADINEETYNLDPKEVEKKITSKTKAIIPVDFTGQPVDIDAFMEIGKKHNIVIIEDGAHSLGASYKKRKVGATADMTMFSFHPVKPITTGEGGMIVTNNRAYYEKLRLFRGHGITQTAYAKEQGDWYYEMTDLGYNYRMTDIQAALGISQMNRLDEFIEKRQQLAHLYTERINQLPTLKAPKQLADTKSGWHLYSVQLDKAALGKTRKKIFEDLREANIGVHVHYIPVYWHPYYQELGYKKGICPKAEQWYERALTLPLHPQMNEADVDFVLSYFK